MSACHARKLRESFLIDYSYDVMPRLLSVLFFLARQHGQVGSGERADGAESVEETFLTGCFMCGGPVNRDEF